MYDANKIFLEYCINFLNDKKYEHVYKYLTNRGLNKEIIKYFNFGYCPKGKIIYDLLVNKNNMLGENKNGSFFNDSELNKTSIINIDENGETRVFEEDRIIIPIYNSNGMVVGFSGRTIHNDISPKYLNSKETKIFNKSKTLFNFHNIKNTSPEYLILCEGFFDVIAYSKIEINNACALMGINLTKDHLLMIKSISSLKYIVLSFDNDRAGNDATIQIGKILVENNFHVYVIGNYDKKYKDVDELIANLGNESLTLCLTNKIDFISYYIKYLLSNTSDKAIIFKIIDEILFYIVENGDILLKNEHLKLINELANVDIELLKEKYNAILNKEYLPPKNIEHKKENPKVLNSYEILLNDQKKQIESILRNLLSACLNNLNNIDKLLNVIDWTLLKQYFPNENELLKLIIANQNSKEEIIQLAIKKNIKLLLNINYNNISYIINDFTRKQIKFKNILNLMKTN